MSIPKSATLSWTRRRSAMFACMGFLALLLFPWSSQVCSAEGTCWVVAIAMNQDPQAPEDWNQYAEEFALVFKEHARSLHRTVKVATIVGRNARLPQIVGAMRTVAAGAKSGDFVAVYVGCHGGTDGRDGWSIETMDGQTAWGRDFKGVAASLPCPVLFVIDTCGSGGFAREHPRDIALPPNCVAICSSRARQSTSNCLNIALHEALWGHADANQDTFIDVNETARYVQSRARKISPPGKGEAIETPVVVIGGSVASDMRLTQVSGKLVAILQDGQWHLARLISEDTETCKVHLMGYQDNPNKGFFLMNEAPKDRVFKLEPGVQPVMVANPSDNQRVRPALLLEMKGDQASVRFVLGKRGRQELVDKALLRLPFASRDLVQ